MKVILKRDVKGLGREGDLKDVKSGYARNFLLPTGAAVRRRQGRGRELGAAIATSARSAIDPRARERRGDRREAPRAQARDPGQGR